MQDAIALVAEILDAELSGIGNVTDDGTELVQTIAATDLQGHPIDSEEHRLPLGAENSMAGYTLNAAKAVVTSDMNSETRFTDQFLRKLNVQSALTVPLHLNNVPFGTLGVYSRRPHTFTSDDIDFAETMSYMVMPSIARIRAEEVLREQNAFQPVESETDVQQRSSPRRNYRYRQLIAPRYDSLMPAKQDFFEVMCEDISAGGVSFYIDQLPDFESLVVALGTPPELTYFSARITRVIEKTYDGHEAWLVGCRFTGRVHL